MNGQMMDAHDSDGEYHHYHKHNNTASKYGERMVAYTHSQFKALLIGGKRNVMICCNRKTTSNWKKTGQSVGVRPQMARGRFKNLSRRRRGTVVIHE